MAGHKQLYQSNLRTLFVENIALFVHPRDPCLYSLSLLIDSCGRHSKGTL